MTKKSENPFSPQAVATFGSELLVSCDELAYMHAVGSDLKKYLADYEIDTSGTTIGIKGGHGAGKTHILTWLSKRAKESAYSKPRVLYAKADSSNFFPLYKQYLSEQNILQNDFIELIGICLRKRAKEHLEKAMFTQALSVRINTEKEYQSLIEEKELDPDELMVKLNKLLEESNISPELIQVILQINHPSLSPLAYNWITGKELDIASLNDLGIKHNLRELNTKRANDETENDLAAINALETIAAVFKLAHIPLIIMLDQFELLMNPDMDTSRQNSLNSLIKKFIEQLTRQNVLVIIAGNHSSWESLHRDVTPRMSSRKPLLIGNLNYDETRALINSFTKFTDKFSEDSISEIFKLSGRMPREVIRIGYYAYEKTAGVLSNVTRDTLLESSKESGTLDDQHTLLLNLADPILKKVGQVIEKTSFGDTEKFIVDRIVKISNDKALILIVIKAADRVSEIKYAKQINEIRRLITQQWARSAIIFVSIGYSSQQVRELFSKTNSVIHFNREDFENQLNSEILKTNLIGAKDEDKTATDKVLFSKIEEIAKELDKLRNQREKENLKIKSDFVERTERLATDRKEEKESKTSWELLEKLDELEDSVNRNSSSPPYANDFNESSSEKRIIRSLLISNEAFIHNNYFDQLGGFYLDILRFEVYQGFQDHVGNIYERKRIIIREMRSVLRKTSFIDKIKRNGLKILILIFVIAYSGSFILLWSLLYFKFGKDLYGIYLMRTIIFSIMSSAVLTGLSYIYYFFYASSKIRRFKV